MSGAPVLYLHVADDGGLLAVDGETGRSTWITEKELTRRLRASSQTGGSILVSQELGSPLGTAIIGLIEASGLPIVPTLEVHQDAVRGGGLTALMSAAYLGATDLAEDLVRRGADVLDQDDDGFTPLMYATNAGRDEMVKLLICAGADVNQVDWEGSTALMFGAQQGHSGIVKRLLVAGADPRAKRTVDGLTAREFAIGNRHDRLADILTAVDRQTS